MPDLTRGSVLANRFTLRERLGTGSLTETWRASDRSTGASVALKIARDRSHAPLLKREWQLALRLMHAHIVRVFEFIDDGDVSFYSQQYIRGSDLSVLAAAPPAHSLPVIAAIADALRYAHAKDIVHKDLKASNVLIDSNGAPYLIDFGVAAAGEDDPGGGSLVASSPQLLDGEDAKPSDDIFALGGLVYEVLSGKPPYPSSGMAEAIRELTPPPLDAGLELPDGLAAFIARMLDKRADARPGAEELVDLLRSAGFAPGVAPPEYRATPEEGGFVEPASIEPRLRPREDRLPEPASAGGLRPAQVGIALAVLIALLMGVVFLLPKRVTEPQPVVDPAPATVEAAEEVEAAEPAAPAEILRDQRVRDRASTEEVLGELLAKLETLESRAVARWGGLPYKRARAAYEAGDAAYLQRDYATATARYREAIELVDPLLDKVDRVFDEAMAAGRAAIESANASEAIDQFELAVAISPNSAAAKGALERARNLGTVLDLLEQGASYERSLELEAARRSYEEAVELDPAWQPAVDGLARVEGTIRQRDFEARMSEGIAALQRSDYLAARAAFRRASEISPGAPEPADGLLQVDQALRLQSIRALESEAAREESNEQWEEAVATYREILELDSALLFAQEGLSRAEDRVRLHSQLDEYIDEPDRLSSPRTLQQATNLLISITRMDNIGPRLEGQRDELSRLLKRASTPLTVELVSDNKTAVSIYKVGRLGSFESRELELRPGTYVAVGSRPGFRDVRLEFRVAPEIDMQPIVVRCEEPI